MLALMFLTYGATAYGDATKSILQIIAENQLIAGLAAAAIGSLLTALIVFIIEDNRDKRKAAVNVLEEFTSFNFLETRNKAGLVFKEHLHSPLKGLDDLYYALQNENWRYVSHMEHFFKKVDKLLMLKEVDEAYISNFLYGEFPHWYNKYFFPAALAGIARNNIDLAKGAEIKSADLLLLETEEENLLGDAGLKVSLPLEAVNYASAFGAVLTKSDKSKKRAETIDMLAHVDALTGAGAVSTAKFRRTGEAQELSADIDYDFLSMFDGEDLPFPNLRKLFKKSSNT